VKDFRSPCIPKAPVRIYDESMNLGMPELIFIFLLALVVVGPKRLPGLARQLGKYMADFKRASNEFKNQLETEMMNIELEERAKKQAEAPRILPPEVPPGPPIVPAPGIVSRGNSEDISGAEPDSSPDQTAELKSQPSSIPASSE
jgi:Tat protein translocase TatB subunit